MGVVFRARDARLERDVAIKVLPAAFTADPERLARFEREAKVLAQLHHPNIASIFGLEEADGVRALVLELVEGPTLAERLEAGPLPLEEALAVARQIAEALEEAHGKGIVHRDLKPQNVKLAPDGRVKVLDFGLAKALDPTAAGGSSSPTQLAASPTLTLGATVQGVILGTAAYMSPEQAKGAAADKRADIWAFGVVLYELLTGARLFQAPSVPETLAQVLTRTPDLAELPAPTPPALRRLLRRCLERNPRNRLHDIADARIVLDELISGRTQDEPAATAATAPAAASTRLRIAAAAFALLATALGVLLAVRAARAPDARAAGPLAVELSLQLGSRAAEGTALAFAPDGSSIVFTARGERSGGELWLRRLGRFDAEPLRGTTGASYPFWSPDARSIGFFRDSDSTLCRYDLDTATVEVLVRTEGGGRGGSWAEDGSILFAPSMNGPIHRLTAPGGVTEPVTELDPGIPDGSHRFPILLPDGRHFLFTVWTNQLEAASRAGGIYVAALDGGEPRRLTPDLSQGALVGGDRLLVRRDEALVALPFDARKLAVGAGGERIADRPLFSLSSGTLAASGTPAGDLAFALATSSYGAQISWLDREGRPTGNVGSERLGVQELVLAPVGDAFVAQVAGASGGNLWVGDARRQVLTRLTQEGVDTYRPVWSPDARRLAYSNETTGNESVYVQEADGSREAELLLADADRSFEPSDWSSDGRLLFLDSWQDTAPRGEVWVYDFQARAARSLLADRAADLRQAHLSPDGRWLAYTSDESGNPEIFVRPFPGLDRKWKISQGGAVASHWRRDGRELVFTSLSDQAVLAVDLEPRPDGLGVGIPKTLFTPRTSLLGLSPDADHARFLVALQPGDARPEPIRLLIGWRR